MKLYRLQSAIDFRGELISIKDGSKRIFRYFVLNDGSSKFLSFSTPSGSAPPPYSVADICQTDYLEGLMPIPIFSARAKEVLMEACSDELEFFPIQISVEGQEIHFFLGKTLLYRSLIDEGRSTHRTLTDGRPVLDREVYLANIEGDFHIARDVEHVARVVVSQRFADICKAYNLKISLKELPQ